jgi:type II secretory pathway component PulF
MKKRDMDEHGSIYPVVIFIIALCVAGFMVLLMGNVLTPFFQLLTSTDSSIDPAITTPMFYMGQLLVGWIWPKGVLICIFIGLVMWLLMDYQKSRYKELY